MSPPPLRLTIILALAFSDRLVVIISQASSLDVAFNAEATHHSLVVIGEPVARLDARFHSHSLRVFAFHNTLLLI